MLLNKEREQDKHPVFKAKLTFGERASDVITQFCGTWKFIISVLVFIAVWISINMLAWLSHWDPYPFILLNFILSCLAAMQAPIILMSQNREAQRDRIQAKYDYQVNRKSEREIENMQKDLDEIKGLIHETHEMIKNSKKI